MIIACMGLKPCWYRPTGRQLEVQVAERGGIACPRWVLEFHRPDRNDAFISGLRISNLDYSTFIFYEYIIQEAFQQQQVSIAGLR